MLFRSSQKWPHEHLENRSTKNFQILHGHLYQPTLQPHQIWHHCLLLVGSYCEKKLSKIPPPVAWVEFLKDGLNKDHEILHGDSRPHKHAGYDVTSCSGRLQNATKYSTKVRKMGLVDRRVIIWPFNLASSNFCRDIHADKAAPDMT